MDNMASVNFSDILPPDLRYDEEKMELHKLDSLSLLLYACLLTLTVITIWIFEKRRVAFIHETGLAIVFGLIIGAILRYGVKGDYQVSQLEVQPINQKGAHKLLERGPPEQLHLEIDRLDFNNQTWVYDLKGEMKETTESIIGKKATFDPEIFFDVILPPIIFNAGYSMKRKYFFRNIGSIFTFAFVGSTISTFTVGGIMYGVTQLVPSLSNVTFIDNLHFGALISATDPVTVLAIFSDLHVDVNLHAFVFGESVLNDATAVVFEEALKNYEESGAACKANHDDCVLDWEQVSLSIIQFFYIFGASFLVGSFMGCSTALLTKFTNIQKHPLLESTLLILMSYSTFLMAEVMGLTGIVAVLFCGICQAHYTFNNLSKESKDSTKNFFGLLNFMLENFIFSYIGVSMFTFQKHRFNTVYIIGAFSAIFVGRLLNIYPLSAFLNLGRKVKISGKLQHMMMFSGLRGAIAFALAIRNTSTEGRQMVLSTTMIIVIVTVIFNGGCASIVLKCLGVPTKVMDDDSWTEPLDGSHRKLEEGDPNMTPVTKPGKSWLARKWGGLDNKLVKPLLTHSNPTLMDTLPKLFLSVGKILSSSEQFEKYQEEKEGREDFEENDEQVLIHHEGEEGYLNLQE